MPNVQQQQSSRRVGVLTFHRCINYGSYWQARGLVEGLRSLGHEVEVLNHCSSRIDRKEWRVALRPVPEEKGPTGPYRKKLERFREALEELPVGEPFDLDDPRRFGAYDAIVVGSDEVWNLAHPWYGQVPLFYGDGLRVHGELPGDSKAHDLHPPHCECGGNEPYLVAGAIRLISYAASFGNFSAQWGLHPWWAGKLTQFDAISVRDHNARKLIRGALAINPAIVLDPCLQWSVEHRGSSVEERGYVAVYGHEFSDRFIRHVCRVADERSLKTVSIGYHNSWADEQWIEAGPHEFAKFMANADLVATNFFHGCVFALRSSKPLLCETMPYRELKIKDLLALLGAGKHLITERTTEAQVDVLSRTPTDEYQETIACLRQRSEEFLQSALR